MGAADYCLREDEMPPLLRVPFIRTGYRRMHQPWAFYLRSLLGLHNETVNVWTHLLGGVLIAYVLIQFLADFRSSAAPLDVGVITLFGASSLFVHMASSLAHLLHSRSAQFHLLAYSLDYVGVAVDCFGYNTVIYCFYSHPNYYGLLRPLVVPVSTLLAILVVASMSHHLIANRRKSSLKARLLSLGPGMIFYAFGVVPVAHKLLLYALGEAVDLQPHHLLHIAILGLGFPLHALRLPERWWPGHFDNFGRGHQWFHLSISISHCLLIRAVRIDLQQRGDLVCSQRERPLSLATLWRIKLLIIGASAVLILALVKRHASKER